MKLEMVKDVDKYELNVLFNEVPSNLDKKNGVAVIIAAKERQIRLVRPQASDSPFQGSSTAHPRMKCIHRTLASPLD